MITIVADDQRICSEHDVAGVNYVQCSECEHSNFSQQEQADFCYYPKNKLPFAYMAHKAECRQGLITCPCFSPRNRGEGQ